MVLQFQSHAFIASCEYSHSFLLQVYWAANICQAVQQTLHTHHFFPFLQTPADNSHFHGCGTKFQRLSSSPRSQSWHLAEPRLEHSSVKSRAPSSTSLRLLSLGRHTCSSLVVPAYVYGESTTLIFSHYRVSGCAATLCLLGTEL